MYRSWREDRANSEASAAILRAVGFRYVPDADCWIHIEQGRAITKEMVAAHDTDWLAHWITEK
jgi:hypothetical protein